LKYLHGILYLNQAEEGVAQAEVREDSEAAEAAEGRPSAEEVAEAAGGGGVE
jgi:hypothetical protein